MASVRLSARLLDEMTTRSFFRNSKQSIPKLSPARPTVLGLVPKRAFEHPGRVGPFTREWLRKTNGEGLSSARRAVLTRRRCCRLPFHQVNDAHRCGRAALVGGDFDSPHVAGPD